MRIRLQVIVSRDRTFDVEAPGPQVVIGRDPDCAVPLAGDAFRAVSWHHARIDLSADRATVSDLGSTNGTFLNDERVNGRATLRKDSYLQLGQRGPTLRVTEIDLHGAPAGPAPARQGVRPPRPAAEPAPIHAAAPVAVLAAPPAEPPSGASPARAKRLALIVLALVGPLALVVGGGLAFFGGGEPPPTTAPPAERPWLCLRCRGSEKEQIDCPKCRGKGHFPCRYEERRYPLVVSPFWEPRALRCEGGRLLDARGRDRGDCPNCPAPQGIPCPECRGAGKVTIPCRVCQSGEEGARR